MDESVPFEAALILKRFGTTRTMKHSLVGVDEQVRAHRAGARKLILADVTLEFAHGCEGCKYYFSITNNNKMYTNIKEKYFIV